MISVPAGLFSFDSKGLIRRNVAIEHLPTSLSFLCPEVYATSIDSAVAIMIYPKALSIYIYYIS